MKQSICKSRKQAIDFCEKSKVQAMAYFKEKGIICRAEKLSKNSNITITEDVGGLWWSGKKTISQKMAEIEIIKSERKTR